jgi:hypothetical protein
MTLRMWTLVHLYVYNHIAVHFRGQVRVFSTTLETEFDQIIALLCFAIVYALVLPFVYVNVLAFHKRMTHGQDFWKRVAPAAAHYLSWMRVLEYATGCMVIAFLALVVYKREWFPIETSLPIFGRNRFVYEGFSSWEVVLSLLAQWLAIITILIVAATAKFVADLRKEPSTRREEGQIEVSFSGRHAHIQ